MNRLSQQPSWHETVQWTSDASITCYSCSSSAPLNGQNLERVNMAAVKQFCLHKASSICWISAALILLSRSISTPTRRILSKTFSISVFPPASQYGNLKESRGTLLKNKEGFLSLLSSVPQLFLKSVNLVNMRSSLSGLNEHWRQRNQQDPLRLHQTPTL